MTVSCHAESPEGECLVASGEMGPPSSSSLSSTTSSALSLTASMIQASARWVNKCSESSAIRFVTVFLQGLLTFLGIPESTAMELVTAGDVTRTLITVGITLLCYHVLFGNRHWRRRRKLVKELNVAKEQLTFLEEELQRPSSRSKSKKSNSGDKANSDDEDDEEIRIFVEGAFDMFHFGHANAFRLARSLGTRLIVGVNSDKSITECKGAPLMNEEDRLAMVEQCKFVDEVISGTPYIMSKEYLDHILERYRIDYVVHGDDPCIVNGRDVYETAKAAGKFRTVPRTEGVSTTDIVGRMLLLTKEHHMSVDKGALGAKSKFLTSSRLIQLFSANFKSPTNDMRVIYIDGSWDMFNPSHVALLKGAKERGDFLVVGIHSDTVVNQQKGMNLPLLNLHERVLSVNGCRFVDDVVIDAPYEITPEMIASLRISEVVHGTCGDGGEDYCSMQDPRYRHAKAAGIFHVMKCQSDFQMENIFKRIQKNQETFQARFDRKMRAETDHLKEKYGSVVSNGGSGS